jgi:signal transduction histidine kinase
VSILLSLLGGRWLSRVIMHPIKNMVTTMKEIEESGIPKKVLIQTETRDELQGMTVTFNHMIDRLRENIEKQNQFVSDASHELKTPLTVIRSYSNLLRRRGIKNEEITLDAIDTIYAEATKMQKMIETLLDLASVEKEQTLDMKQTDLVLIFEQIVKQLQQVYKRELVLHYDQTPIMIEVDELKMKQVLIILLDNAIKYSTDKIEVTVEKKQEGVIIKVKDYGIGIPKEDLAHIFERFYRVDKARSRATGGTGLGLSIAQTIVRQHKGEIFIKSEEEQGTEVVIHLPVSSVK